MTMTFSVCTKLLSGAKQRPEKGGLERHAGGLIVAEHAGELARERWARGKLPNHPTEYVARS
jgi:hypothetical protein